MPAPCRAELDAVQLRLLEQYETPLRWDNVDGVPHWLRGVKPKRHLKSGLYAVGLSPGESTWFRAPEFSHVRLVGVGGGLDPSAVEVWLDNGSGLLVRQQPMQSDDGASLLIDPDSAEPSVVRVTCPYDAACGMQIALFVSRREYLPEIAPHREAIKLCGPTVRVKRDDEARGLDFTPLVADELQTFSVEGPTRLAVVTRLRYAAREERLDQTWRIEATIDGVVHRHLEFETTAESRHLETVNTCAQVLGRIEIGYLDIPCGKHEVSLDSTAPVYLRVQALKSPDYLLPYANQPRVTVEQVRRHDFLFDHVISPWELTQQDLRSFVPLATHDSHAAEWVAWRSVRDNGHLDGGLQGYLLLREAARQRRDAPQLRRLANELRGRHTFYRDLLPATEILPGSHRAGWFATRRMRRMAEPVRGMVLNVEQLDDALDDLSGTRFIAVGSAPERATRYRPATVRSTSLLRVAVDRMRLDTPELLYVQFDDRIPIVMEVVPTPTVECEERLPGNGESGLVALRQRHLGLPGETLGGPFSQFRQPAPFVAAGYAEVLLPSDIREIAVWSSEGAEIGVALQCRVARPFRLSETQFLEMCRRSDCDLETTGLASRFGYARIGIEPLSASEREVANQLLEWQRRLAALSQWYVSEVRDSADRSGEAIRGVEPKADDPLVPPAPLTAPLADTKEAREQPLVTLERWNKAVAAAQTDDERRAALFGRIAALADLGEEFLHERQLRGLFVHGRDAETRKEAGSALWRLYRERGERDLLIALLATSVLQSPQTVFVRELSEVFLAEGQPRDALLTALTLPPHERPLSVVLAATYELRWWQTFETHLSLTQDPDLRARWEGLRAADLGQYDLADQALLVGDATSRQMAEHLMRGRTIALRAASDDAEERLAALGEWSDWQVTHPGPRVWREETSVIHGSAGTAIVRAIEHDTHATFYRARLDHPLRLLVPGPLRLKCEMRPVHAAGSVAALHDWIRVTACDAGKPVTDAASAKLWPVAILDNRASDGLEITGSPTLAIGTRVEHELNLGPGWHAVEVAADQSELLVRLFAERPLTPLPVLPPLTTDVIDAVLVGTWGQAANCCQPGAAGTLRLIRPGCCRPDEVALCLPIATATSLLRDTNADRQAQRIREVTIPSTTGRAKFGDVVAEHLARKDWSAALAAFESAASTNVSPILIRQRMNVLLFLKETFAREQAATANDTVAKPESEDADEMNESSVTNNDDESVAALLRQLVVAGEALRAAHPRVDGVQALHRRLLAGQGWTRHTEIAASGGVKRIVMRGNSPESPRQRVRAALLPPVVPGEQRIYGDEVLALRFKNKTAIRVEVTLTAEHLDFLPAAPIPVIGIVDGAELWNTTLPPGRSRTEELRMEAGSHTLRIRLGPAWANQYVRVLLRERAEGDDEPFLPIERELEKEWLVATPAEPVRFRIAGPAWVRIDKWESGLAHADAEPLETSSGEVHSQYVPVAAAGRDFTLLPSDGESQSLFRVFVRTPLKDYVEEPQPLLVKRNVMPIPDPLIDRYRARRLSSPELKGHPEAVSQRGRTLRRRTRTGSARSLNASGMMLTAGSADGSDPFDDLNAFETAVANDPLDDLNSFETSEQSDAFEASESDDEMELDDATEANEDTQTDEVTERRNVPKATPKFKAVGQVKPPRDTAEAGVAYLSIEPDEVFAALDVSSPPLPASFEDEYELGGQEAGTWSFGLAHINRRPLDQGITGDSQDIFTQFMTTYRYFDEQHHNYWAGDLIYRDRDPGNGSFGARGLLWHDSERVPLTFITESSVFVQQPGGAIAPASDNTEFALYWRGEVLQRREINDEWSHIPSATVFARYLSMNSNTYGPGRVDQDIYTTYRTQHRYGAILADTFVYQPTLDTQLWVRPSLTTNEDFNGFAPDHVSLRFGWRQLVSYADIELTYRLTEFLADEDRAHAVTQHLVDADFAYDLWCRERHRGEAGFYVQHDILKQASGFGASVTLFLDQGRGYRDFVPGDARFKSRKRLREAVHANNAVWQVAP